MPTRTVLTLALLSLTAALGLACATGEPALDGASPGIYDRRPPSQGGTGKIYMGREISLTMTWHGIPWLEREDREERELPDRVVEAMALAPGDVVADIGAGSGYFTFRIARRVPEGRVLAVDVQDEMLTALGRRMDEEGLDNVDLILGAIDDPKLPPAEVDAALMVDAYHEFSHPYEMMTRLVEAIRPGGRVILVEYRGEDRDSHIHPLHRMTEAQVRREMAAVGLDWVKTLDFLPDQHMLIFTKPAGEAPG
ncbi:MAG: class I SAM-dependent methyltransferase [Acidobacteriota bacterium]